MSNTTNVLSRLFKRKSFLLISACLIIFIYHSYTSITDLQNSNKPKQRNNLLPDYDEGYSNSISSKLSSSYKSSDTINSHNSNLLKNYLKELSQYKPNPQILNDPEYQLEFTKTAVEHNLVSLSYLESLVTIQPKWFDEVKEKHSNVVKLLKEKMKAIKSQKETDPNHYSNLEFHSIERDGAVIVGGHINDNTWLALVSTRLFRKAGGILPVEVMLPKREDYLKDREICDKYLPQMNAKCVIMEDILKLSDNIDENGNQIDNDEINSEIWIKFYDIKRELAILLSSFENVLYLTPENIMLKPMEHNIFEKQLYKDNGLFLWTDYGPRTTLVSFYEITDIKFGNKKTSEFGLPLTEELNKKAVEIKENHLRDKINFHDLENTLPFKQSDASEIIINKRVHLSTLILSLYYNLNGPNVYYILLTGDKDGGFGHKETVTAASHVLNNPYYSINTNVDSNGYWYGDEFHGVSMLQYDPIVDSYSYEAYMDKYSKKGKHKLTYKNYQRWLKQSNERRSPLFLNINNPALRPIELIKDNIVKKENGDRIKLISDTPYFGGLFERDIWRVMNDYICHLQLDSDYVKKHFGKSGSKEQIEFCNGEMKEHMVWVSN